MDFIKPIHSILRYGVLFFGLIAVVMAIMALIKKRNYTSAENKMGLFFMIFCDIQLLLGLVLYFDGGYFDLLTSFKKEVLRNPAARFFTIEHFATMILAWLLVHVGRVMVKRADNNTSKHRRTLLFYGIALLLIIAMIPWPFKQAGIGRPFFPIF
jgi:hypothetical protein